MSRRIGAVSALLLVFGVSPAVAIGPPISSYDLTGTWQGTIKCKARDTGAKISFTLEPTSLVISQSGLGIAMRVSYAGGGFDDYVAVANPDAKKPLEKGELALVVCGTNDQVGDEPDFDEIGRMKVKAKPPKVKATFGGTSLYSDPGLFDPEVGTCKWKFTRVDTTDPLLPQGCDPP
jgi:hypothetical protein